MTTRPAAMSRRARSTATLASLALIMVVATVWGWSALTKPLPTTITVSCQDTTVQAGDTLTRDMVTVSVLNASGSAGLATKTMDALLDRGFARGITADAPPGTRARGIQLWSDDRTNPAVALVRGQFTKAGVADRSAGDTETAGVVVVVGKNPAKLKKSGPESIKVSQNATVCSPPLG